MNAIKKITQLTPTSLHLQEILEQVKVVNLDTGEELPLSLAEEKLPTCVNPLSLHIMRRTKEYSRWVAGRRERVNVATMCGNVGG